MVDNYVNVLGDVIFSNYSHAPEGIGTDTDTIAIVESGATIADAEAEAFFYNSDISGLYTESSGASEESAFEGSANSDAQVIANFTVEAGETFSFDFSEDLLIETKEIDNPDAEYNQAQLNIGFVLLDTSDLDEIEVLDYADLWAYLVSSEQISDLEVYFSDNFTLSDGYQTIDIDGDNELDFISSTTIGTYQHTFDQDTNLTLLKVSQSDVQWLGDSGIGNLDSDFVYGTLWEDNWFGTQADDSYYASLGDDLMFAKNGNDLLIAGYGDDTLLGGNDDDTLRGEHGNDSLSGSNGDDLLEGGAGDDLLDGSNGDDLLRGGIGNDSIDGSNGDDTLFGGRGNDTLTGGFGADRFYYQTFAAFQSIQIGEDLITDLEVNEDKILLSQTTFTALTGNIGESINAAEFEVVANDELAAVSSAFITYSSGSGNLFYNQNGLNNGLGQGGQFATLENLPIVSAADLIIVE
ncbi:MAG: calcium-binding protein [Pleurocapsa sp. MO_226.B13]|nr:calcium-binding protein [Pleurocapsa sp. MO_226.B13]